MAGLGIRGKGLKFVAKNADGTTSEMPIGALEDVVKRKCGDKAFAKMNAAAQTTAESIAHANFLGFFSVTGNLYASMGVTVVRNDPKNGRYVMSRVYLPYMIQGGKPTRKSLKKGEAYDLPAYYSGHTIKDDEKRYVGETAGVRFNGIEYSKDVRNEVRTMGSRSKKEWMAVHAYAAIPYAAYVNATRDNPHFMDMVKAFLKSSL